MWLIEWESSKTKHIFRICFTSIYKSKIHFYCFLLRWQSVWCRAKILNPTIMLIEKRSAWEKNTWKAQLNFIQSNFFSWSDLSSFSIHGIVYSSKLCMYSVMCVDDYLNIKLKRSFKHVIIKSWLVLLILNLTRINYQAISILYFSVKKILILYHITKFSTLSN